MQLEETRIQTELPAFHVKDMAFYYGTKKALQDVNIDIPDKMITAMIGPSGCGKSTFLKSLNRIGELEGQIRVEGKIQFFGQDVYAPNVNLGRLRKQVTMVFQRPNPFPSSIYDNIAYGPRINGITKKSELDEIVETSLRGSAIFEEVKDKLKTSALGLSGGQQQRICIARALAVKPKVILMDEPCSALDPISTMKVEDLMLSLRGQVTIVIVTHNMQQASRVSDYTAFFNTDETRIGQLVEFGPTTYIFSAARSDATRDYVQGRFG